MWASQWPPGSGFRGATLNHSITQCLYILCGPKAILKILLLPFLVLCKVDISLLAPNQVCGEFPGQSSECSDCPSPQKLSLSKS